MKKPELLGPPLANPDELPAPELKNPDDGMVVEFPKPGAAGMSMTGIAMGPMPPVPAISIAVVGPPMVALSGGREMTISETVRGPMLMAWVVPVSSTLMSAVYLGMVKPSMVRRPNVALIGISIGISTSRFTGMAVSGI
ncbi:hypothetical protein LAUMK4_03099 [Mycobacterium persicum]|uniref:Uncharacterized protein n=1 Tax=Mycobacterium persicum TaxID=1487726 RepID=A0AB38UUE6_9MYCO|nr:hypothetical protein LAUMK42_03152 [Mycobacterium persicum]VAZ95315.1 hypothetical protein LAUMK4_03099 [Mycobacterium persicum]